MLRQHCAAVSRDYGTIEKTTMIAIDPTSTKEDVVRTVTAAAELGFTATYVYATGITEPARVIDLLGSALPELN